MTQVSDQQAIEHIVGKLEGRTIVRSGVDLYDEGFHIELDDGVVVVLVGIIGLYRMRKETLQ